MRTTVPLNMPLIMRRRVGSVYTCNQVRLFSESRQYLSPTASNTANPPNASPGSKFLKAITIGGVAAGAGIVGGFYYQHGRLPTTPADQKQLLNELSTQLNTIRSYAEVSTSHYSALLRQKYAELNGLQLHSTTPTTSGIESVVSQSVLNALTSGQNSEDKSTTQQQADLTSNPSSEGIQRPHDTSTTPTAAPSASNLLPTIEPSQAQVPEGAHNNNATITNGQRPPVQRERKLQRYLSPTCRRHIVRVYQLLISSIGATAAGFLVANFMAGSVPFFAPMALVIACIASLGLLSVISPTAQHQGLIITARRAVFYLQSASEGAAVFPLAKALGVTSTVASGLVLGFAVLAGFAAVALYSGQGCDEACYTSAGISNYTGSDLVTTRQLAGKDAHTIGRLKASTLNVEGFLFGNSFAFVGLTVLNSVYPEAFAQSALLHFGAALFSVAVAMDSDTLISRFDTKVKEMASAARKSRRASPTKSFLSANSSTTSASGRSIKHLCLSTALIEDDADAFYASMLNETMYVAFNGLNVAVRLGEMIMELAWDSDRSTGALPERNVPSLG